MSRFDKLRQARESGQRNTYQEVEQEPIFDLVTEEVYAKIAKKAVLEDDFVVDDDGQYNGIEDWDHHSEYSDEEVQAKPKKKKVIDQFKPKPKKVEVLAQPTEDDNEIMASIFKDIENDIPVHAQKKLKTLDTPFVKASQPSLSERDHLKLSASFATVKQEYPSSSSFATIKQEYPTASTSYSSYSMQMDDEPIYHEHEDKVETKEESPVPVKPTMKVKQVNVKALKSKPLSANTQKFLPKFEKLEKLEPTVIDVVNNNNKSWTEVKDSIKVTTAMDHSQVNVKKMDQMLESDGSMFMYWIDAFEKNGHVFLFGKVYHREANKYVSCCVTVKGIERNVFVLSRVYKLDENGNDTKEDVTIGDVYAEFDQIRRKNNIKEFKTKAVQRSYAFELPDVPSQSDYLKVVYSFTEPELPVGLSGRTFSRIFGAKTGALELFMLKRKFMGPCWIHIKNGQASTKNISWCKLEIVVEDPKDVSVYTPGEKEANKEAPPLVVMSLNLRTVMNTEKNANEIVAASTLTYNNVNIDTGMKDAVAAQSTIIRRCNGTAWPSSFTEDVKKRRTRVQLQENERALLNCLINTIFVQDPDIIVGHNVIDFDLDVLLQRMKLNGVNSWSRLGRLRRTAWPKLQAGAGGTSDSSYSERQIVSGRLLCDTFRAAKDFLNSKSNSLTFLSNSQLSTKRDDIEYEKIAEYFFSSQLLLNMLDHMETDTYLVVQLMEKLQVIPLTKQLTNLAGNLWSRTMVGARAERNEFLLLHKFHQAKYICPDKSWNSNGQHGDEEVVVAKKGRKKAAYAGGLVLDPKVGLYDKYVLLLDFNSLYPSIIQEYNICFTTVERTYGDQDDSKPPPLPESSHQQAILPQLLASLVARRRAVKDLMKKCEANDPKYAEYDIRQKALKLTANSMYGCLGFSHSRFFAKPIAMLITSQGREILQRTVTMAQELNLEVIYGDTDSIMIYTNTDDLNIVTKMGEELKAKVNGTYKLLEIEMDGLFKKILLLKKKKYAAITVTQKVGGEIIEKMETKGLDLVRRDWCDLSQEVSLKILNFIFSSNSKEDTVDKVHEYLTRVSSEVRGGIIPVEKYVINKGLTKNPSEYADKDSQPHVQVALRMAQSGMAAKVGDTIPYVICVGEGSSLGKRAFHIDEVKKEGSSLEIDLEWYLANQIHPPVARLCLPIEGTDNSRLAQALGLDAKKFAQQTVVTQLDEERLYTLDSQISDEERYKNVEKFMPKCNHCHHTFEFTGLVRMNENTGRIECQFVCPNPDCEQLISANYLAIQMRNLLRTAEKKYLDQQVVCDDATCNTRTKMHGVFGEKCLNGHCSGKISLQITDKQLYDQMQYFEWLLDNNRMVKLYPDYKDALLKLETEFGTHIQHLKALVNEYLDTNFRRMVDLATLFSRLMVGVSLPSTQKI